MMRPICVAVVCAFLMPLQVLARPAVSKPETWNISVHVPSADYTAQASVFRFSAGHYRASIVAIGSYNIPKGDNTIAPVALTFADVVKNNPNALVINGGYIDSSPAGAYAQIGRPYASPFGLLMVRGYALHPFNFDINAQTGFAKLSAILCETPESRLKMLRLEDYAPPQTNRALQKKAPSIEPDCTSALQAGPRVVENGVNGITEKELQRMPAQRTMVAFDKKQNLYVVMFTTPIHLQAAAAFLLSKKDYALPKHQASITIAAPGAQPKATQGLEVDNVMNLGGDIYSVAVAPKVPTIGEPGREQTSAVVIGAR